MASELVAATACRACGGRLSWWRTVRSSEPGLRNIPFELARCTRCGTAVTLGSAPPELHESGAYGQGAPRLQGLAMPLLRAFDRQRLGLLDGFAAPRMAILDVGAGRGRFVRSARRAGFDARGDRALGARFHGGRAARCRGGPRRN